MEQRQANYDTLKYLFLDPTTSENQTAINILFGEQQNPGDTTPTEALRTILVSREAYPQDILRDSVGFKNRVCSASEDINFERQFCEYTNTEAKSDKDFVAIDCNRWIKFFKYLRKLVLNRYEIVGGVSIPPARGSFGGRKSRSKRQRRTRKTNKNHQRSRRKSIHRRK